MSVVYLISYQEEIFKLNNNSLKSVFFHSCNLPHYFLQKMQRERVAGGSPP